MHDTAGIHPIPFAITAPAGAMTSNPGDFSRLSRDMVLGGDSVESANDPAVDESPRTISSR
jgi:hypothetical protein